MSDAGVFSANDAVEMAIQTEQNGYAFYVEAAEAAHSEDVRELMSWLAEQEQQHEETFRQMLEIPVEHSPIEEYAGQKGEFIQVLLQSRVLPDEQTGKAAAENMSEDLDVIAFALGFEKDTILFQYEMRDMVPDSQKDAVDDIIAEEKKHIATLNEMEAKLA